MRPLLLALAMAAGAGAGSAAAAESWNSPCLLEIRQIKEDWTRLNNPELKAAVSREVTRAEQNYRRGQEERCQQRVQQIKAMMK